MKNPKRNFAAVQFPLSLPTPPKNQNSQTVSEDFFAADFAAIRRGRLGCFRQYSDCDGVSCPPLLPSTDGNGKCQTHFSFFRHYYGLPVLFFQMAAVFFSSLLRYARPFWANFPVTPYYNGNVRFAKNGRKNGRKKSSKSFQTYCLCAAVMGGGYSVFQ